MRLCLYMMYQSHYIIYEYHHMSQLLYMFELHYILREVRYIMVTILQKNNFTDTSKNKLPNTGSLSKSGH